MPGEFFGIISPLSSFNCLGWEKRESVTAGFFFALVYPIGEPVLGGIRQL